MRARVAGMSLVELMVAVGIISVLGTIAMPRYKNFLVQSRRGEAYTNLAHIETLQQTYKYEHAEYYVGAAGKKGVGYRDGKSRDGDCNNPDTGDVGIANILGFRPNNCTKLRYLYRFSGNIAEASAASDANKRFIYPDCNGKGCRECGYVYGDTLLMPVGTGEISLCRNITKYCPLANVTCTSNSPCGCKSKTSPSPPNWQPLTSTECHGVSFEQTATVTQTWTTNCASYSCPPASTRTLRRAAIGTDTSCTTNNLCTKTNVTMGTWARSDPTINLNNLYECETTTEKRTNVSHYSPPGSCPDITQEEVRNINGNKQVTCDEICTKTTTGWSTCAGSAAPCKQYKSINYVSCANPCPTVTHPCPPEKRTYQTCTCPNPTCSNGSTVATEEAACTAKGTGWKFSRYDIDGDGVDCECNSTLNSNLCPGLTSATDIPDYCSGSNHIWKGPNATPRCECQCNQQLQCTTSTISHRKWRGTPHCDCVCDSIKEADCYMGGGDWDKTNCICTTPNLTVEVGISSSCLTNPPFQANYSDLKKYLHNCTGDISFEPNSNRFPSNKKDGSLMEKIYKCIMCSTPPNTRNTIAQVKTMQGLLNSNSCTPIADADPDVYFNHPCP